MALAERIEHSPDVLRNAPFYALGLSYHDRVKVNDIERTLRTARVVAQGDHSTPRIFAKKVTRIPEFRHSPKTE